MKVLLVCNAGMSTGIMQLKLQEEAKKDGIDAAFEAVPMSELEDFITDADIVLLGPQIRFVLEDAKKIAAGKPVLVIDTQDFGLMRADHVWQSVRRALNK